MKNMKYSLYVISFFLMLFFTFCKKTVTPEPTPNTPTAGSNFTYSSMRTNYTFLDYNNTITIDSSAEAEFYLGPNSSGPPTNITAGNVSLNSFNIVMQSGNLYYTPNPNPLNITGTLNWDVAGSGTITAFSHSYTASYPKYTDGNLLPDTCIKANGITINVSGVSNYITASSNSGLTVHLIQNSIVSKPIFGNTGGTVNFTSAELAGFTINTPINIMITIVNFNKVTINGVDRDFCCSLTYEKIAYLK